MMKYDYMAAMSALGVSQDDALQMFCMCGRDQRAALAVAALYLFDKGYIDGEVHRGIDGPIRLLHTSNGALKRACDRLARYYNAGPTHCHMTAEHFGDG
jgi:hypothetical protein